MLGVLRVLAKPWCWPGRLLALKNTVFIQLAQVLDLQREVKAEVRELHQSSLLAAIHIIEAQERAREELVQECARLERRIEVLERLLGGSADAPGSPMERNRAA